MANTNLKEIIESQAARIEALETKLAELEAKIESTKTRDRGPSSTREMTDDDARRILTGDLKDLSHKAAAEELGLSYAQVYSCRGHYTFKHVHKEIETDKKVESPVVQ